MRVDTFLAAERAVPPARPVNICGVLVHVRPEQRFRLRDELNALAGVEVHAMADEGKLVVVVEDSEDDLASTTINRINDIKGVLSVALVYHHFDSELEGEIVL
jgi:nitrate reductase NapD